MPRGKKQGALRPGATAGKGFCQRCGRKLVHEDILKHTGFCKTCRTQLIAGLRRMQAGVRRVCRIYGITEQHYEQMFVAQGGVCAICKDRGEIRTDETPVLCVDHDHATGAVRALLCRRCNIAIGLLGDDPVHALSAANHLVCHSARRSA